MRALLIAASLLALAACSKPAGKAYSEDVTDVALIKPSNAQPAAAAAPPADSRAAAPAADASAKAEPPARPAITIPMLAYRYGYTLEAPAGAIRDLVTRHETACQTAGPALCQLTGSRVTELGKDRVQGQLTLKAAPAWLKAFRAGLDAEAKAARGRVVSANVNSEDLSRQIVDTEAALRAKTTLRDRLQNLLASRPGKLSELLEVEGELARVQGEIDATQSELAEMRGRVATSELTLTYESTGVLAPQGVFSPLGSAFHDALGIVVEVLAGLVRVAAFLLPIAALVGLAVWLLRGRLFKGASKIKKDG